MWILVTMMFLANSVNGNSVEVVLRTIRTTLMSEEACQETAQTINKETWKTDLLAYCAPQEDQPKKNPMPTRKEVIP